MNQRLDVCLQLAGGTTSSEHQTGSDLRLPTLPQPLPKREGSKIALLLILLHFAMVIGHFSISPASAARNEKFDEMSLDRWAKLREVERHQLNIADKYYGKGEWKIAIAEYEKYLKLYEASEGASYAQMRWSICQVQLRKLNTAIKDGFQSVIDYWPESPDATKSAYLIASTYRDMGQVVNAKKAYGHVIEQYPDDVVTVRAKLDLIELAKKEDDDKRVLLLLNDLTFGTKRTEDNSSYCVHASRDLALRYFYAGVYDEAVKALETSYKDSSLSRHIYEISAGPISTLTVDEKRKEIGAKLADRVIALINEITPTALTDDAAKSRAKTYAYWIADTHSRARRPAEVIKVYQQMEKTFGVDDGLLDNFAQWYRGQNKRDEARKVYARFENQIQGQSRIAYMWREESKWDQAIAIYEALEAQDKERSTEWRWQIAECYDAGGKLREAIGSYQLAERYPASQERMAWCYRRLKEYPKALDLYGQIITAYPDSGSGARYSIGETFEAMGKDENAIRAFQQVCRDYPTSGQASRAHAHLQNKYKINVTLGGAKED